MRLLHTITLLAILGQCVVASTTNKDDSTTTVEVCKQDESLCENGILNDDSEFIINFVKRTKLVNEDTLVTLVARGSETIINKVLAAIDFTQEHFVSATYSSQLLLCTGALILLLGKIESLSTQESVVRERVKQLFDSKRTDYIDSLLVALEDERSLSATLSDVAIQETFVQGARHYDLDWTRRHYDHLTITPQVYAKGLIGSGRYNPKGPTFIQLLEEADLDDLRAVRDTDWYVLQDATFRCAIIDAEETAKPGGSRHDSRNGQRAEIVKDTFKELGPSGVPKVIADLISSYLVGEMEVNCQSN